MIQKMTWSKAQEILKNSDKAIYLEFTTEWCGDCIMMEPIVEEFVSHFDGDKDVLFLKVDAEEANLFRDANSKYKILKVPSHLFIKNNKILKTLYEYNPKEVLIEELNKLK